MKNLFTYYPLYQFNKDLLETIQHKKVNHIQLFAANDHAKVSVVLKPDKDSGYYGLHPSFSEDSLIQFIQTLSVHSGKTFWNKITEEKEIHNFSLSDQSPAHYPFRIEMKEYEELLLGRTIIQMASHYGFRLYCDKKTAIYLKTLSYKLFNASESFSEEPIDIPEKTYYYQTDSTGEYIDLLGVWPSTFLEKLAKEAVIREDEDKLHITLRGSDNKKNFKVLSIMDLQNNDSSLFRRHFSLLTSDVFYSGVMPRVTHIEYHDNHAATSDVKYITLNVGRTTFATVDCMDNSEILSHPFFKESFNGHTIEDIMQTFDKNEDIVQEQYLYSGIQTDENQRVYEREYIDQINLYLSHSYNTHTVAVSANIETSDDYLLIGKRGRLTIDNNEYYCSVNGQSEFNDENVDFYKQSVYEDLPTMHFTSDSRVDLNNEIHRESIAEIGLSLFEKDWEYYGVSFLSINNNLREKDADHSPVNDQLQPKKRRMHFNVLMYNKAYHDFESVYSNHKNVTENFENSFFEGIKVRVYNNWINRAGTLFDSIATHTYNHSGIFSLLIVFTLFVLNLLRNQNITIEDIEVETIFNATVISLYLFMVFIKWAKLTKIRKYLRSVSYSFSGINESKLFKKNGNRVDSISGKINSKYSRKNTVDPHAILQIMYTLYVLQKSNGYIKKGPFWEKLKCWFSSTFIPKVTILKYFRWRKNEK